MFSVYFWIAFLAFIIIALVMDLGVLHKRPQSLSMRTAGIMTFFWFSLAMLFNIMLYFYAGDQKAMEFLTGYLVELSLSVDNVFVFVLLFTYFKVERRFQHRVLFWGVCGAIVMRFIMITAGIYLVEHFKWIFYVFGVFLIYSAYKIMFSDQHEVDPADNKLILWLKKYIRLTDQYHGEKFTIIQDGKRYCTPLLIVLILVEKTDLVFAMDSIPAILAITRDAFIVFTSNIFAILGLRSLYFLLVNLVDRFVYLKYGLGFILSYIGVKMILVVQEVHIPIALSLSVIIVALALSIIISFVKTRKV